MNGGFSCNGLDHRLNPPAPSPFSCMAWNRQDPKRRYVFDQARKFELESEGYTGHALSRWSGPASETRALFVDEGQCVGCLKCALEAPSSFSIEMQFGKARVVQQWADAEDKLKAAVSVCPVSCIHWVGRSDLPALEYVMRRDMKSAQGKTRADPFGSAAKFTRRRGAAQSPPVKTRQPSPLLVWFPWHPEPLGMSRRPQLEQLGIQQMPSQPYACGRRGAAPRGGT